MVLTYCCPHNRRGCDNAIMFMRVAEKFSNAGASLAEHGVLSSRRKPTRRRNARNVESFTVTCVTLRHDDPRVRVSL